MSKLTEAMLAARHWELQCVDVPQLLMLRKGVYVIEHIPTTRKYIGATTDNFCFRWKQHQTAWAYARIPEMAAMSNRLLIAQFMSDNGDFSKFKFSVLKDMYYCIDSEILAAEAAAIETLTPYYNIKK